MNEPLVGFAFPFRIAGGGIRRAQEAEKVAQNVRHLLSTRLGERVMLRDYGGGVHHRLQDPNDATLRALVKHEIEQALRVYLPEVRLTSPLRLTTQRGELRISIEYTASPEDTVRRLELEVVG